MGSMTNIDEHREFLEYFKAHVDPNDQLPVRVPGYHLLESEIDGEVINWVLQYLLQMRCTQSLLAPIVNEVVQKTRKSYLKIPKQCGLDGYAYNPLKLIAIVISHTNGICERLLDNAELNEILAKSSASVLMQTPRHCVKAIKNTRRKMEDRHVCIGDFNGMFAVRNHEPTSFYGVFDGHGGQDAAFFTAAHLCYNIAKSSKYPHNIEGAIKEAFLKTDVAFIDKSDKHALNCGTTALACIYRAIEKRLFVGWVGDSQALLVCEGKVCQIVSPHVPSVESECSRIEKLGGVVLNWNGTYRVNGQLAVSRAIGDAPLKPYITGEPDVSTISLEGKEDFLIIASDGLWESLSEDFIALFVYRMIADNPECADSIAENLVERARKGTSDNITVVVVFFKDPHLIAKSSWLNKMEAAYDKNNTNSAFDNELISSPTIAKNSYNESNSVHISDKSTDVVDHHQRFVDDFGPETDVDTMDDSNVVKSPLEHHTNDSLNEYNLSNGVKPFSLENKIIQQLSEQNLDFSSDSNPFKNDSLDLIGGDHVLLDQTIAKVPSPSGVVDNKIIDALESLAVSKDSSEKNELESEKQINDLLDTRQKSPEILDFTEKIDNIHEKSIFDFNSAAEVDDAFIQHSENTLNRTIEQDATFIEKVDTTLLTDTACVEESVGEDTEEEEDEWNYIKGGDKKSEINLHSNIQQNTNLNETNCVEESSPVESEPIDPVQEPLTEVQVENSQLLDFSFTNYTEKEDTFEKKEKDLEVSKPADAFEEFADPNVPDENRLEENTSVEKEEQPAVIITQKLAETEDSPLIVSPSVETTVSSEDVDHRLLSEDHPVESEQILLEETVPAYITNEQTLSEISSDLATEEILPPENLAKATATTNDTEAAAENKETVDSEEPITEQKSLDQEPETSVDGELERPNSLSLEMASRLNPEAKEFVPICSPSKSNPTSPVANAPTMVTNSFLLLDDDTVVAQSPKKCTTTMDNIDVPEEDDFQHEMEKRPHELAKPSEYINGNAETSARSHSPASEPSYQELNLKEAMQADEKMDHDYSDEKQIVPKESPDLSNDQNVLNVLNKDQDPMNMSFYEGRDEALLSNGDELNKVHVLPEEEDFEDQPNEVVDTNEVDVCDEDAPIESPHIDVVVKDKVEFVEPEIEPQATLEDEVCLETKTEIQEEPSAAIFAVASQVVNDVAALVDQMQIEPITTNDLLEDELQQEAIVNEKATDSEDLKMEQNQDILISLENQNEIKPLEDSLVVDQPIELFIPSATEDDNNVHSTETEELVSPLVESVQQEVVGENEFITDESVLNVPSPSQTSFFAEPPVKCEPVGEEIAKEEKIAIVTDNLPTELLHDSIETAIVDNLLSAVTPVQDQAEATSEVKLVEDVKTEEVALKTTASKVSAATTKSTSTTKVTTTKSLKPSVSCADKKTPTSSKLSPKTAKTTTTSKLSNTASTVKRASGVSQASSTVTSRSVGAAKPSTAPSNTRPNSVSTVASRSAVAEKKALPMAKKPVAAAVNGDVKAATTARKPLAGTTLKPSTATKNVATTGSSSSAPSARLQGTTTKLTSAKPLTTTTKSSASSVAKPSSASSRTTTTVPAAKPRAMPSNISKTTSATSSVANKTNQGPTSTVSKRVSTVGTAASKTTTATRTATSTATKATSVTSRTSTVSKLSSSSTVSTVRKTTAASPAKKSVSSPATKTTSKTTSTGKAVATTKVAATNHVNDSKALHAEGIANDLLDFDKQLKNDNNHLITKNGIDSPMMVIDSAAD
ncbi:uncharacterized protein LOC134211808 isoform X2 [Armigeres subalbatus]|uniref:uncharacterized protein LOC134211808 isoform X2 n=1 Tax=Armigeres subalbatus TaxID=124917 RepID=UPI002ED4097F